MALLTDRQIIVEAKDGLQYCYAVMDRSIVWYGNINYMSYSVREASALRFESPDIAGDLLELREDRSNFQQLHIDEF